MDIHKSESAEFSGPVGQDDPLPQVPDAVLEVPDETGANTPLEQYAPLPDAVVPRPDFETVAEDAPTLPQVPEGLVDALREAARHRDTTVELYAPVHIRHQVDPDSTFHDDVITQAATWDQVVTPPNTVVLENEDELRAALYVLHSEAAGDSGIVPGRNSSVMEEVEAEVAHEETHRQTTARVDTGGNAESVYMVRQGADGFQAFHMSIGLETTRVGAAVVAVSPDPPSITDSDKMRILGYDNVQAVVAAAAKRGVWLPDSLQKWVDPEQTPDVGRTVSNLIGADASAQVKPLDPVTEINRAYAYAPVSPPDERMSVPGDLTDPTRDMLPADDSPDEKIRIPGPDTLILPPNVVPVRTAQELYDIIWSGHPVMQRVNFDIAGVKREDTRAEVAESLGYTKGFFGMVAGYQPEQQSVTLDVRFFAPGLEVSKLEAALINVGVYDPTKENLQAMQDLGFSSVEEVAQKAQALRLPIPRALRRMVE